MPWLPYLPWFPRHIAPVAPATSIAEPSARHPRPQYSLEQEADRSTGFWALLTEGHDSELFFETGLLFRIARPCQAVSQLDEAFLFLLPGFDAGLDELNDDAVGARAAGPRQRFHPASKARRKRDTLTDALFNDGHTVILHRLAP